MKEPYVCTDLVFLCVFLLFYLLCRARTNSFLHTDIVLIEPGCLQFEKRGYLVKESCGKAEIGVLRQNGADGVIGVKWRTIDKSAINGKDYSGGEGEIKFKHGEVKHTSYFTPISISKTLSNL